MSENLFIGDLKKRATAAELCLIDAVEESLRSEAAKLAIDLALDFIDRNPPPTRDDVRFSPDEVRKWVARFKDHMGVGE